MRISHLLDLPSVSFSSGQTRRGRIAAALLTRPVLLLLEDPMAGLDVQSRKDVSDVLGRMDAEGEIRTVLVLRGKVAEGVPEWVGNIVEVRQGQVWIGSREEWEAQQHVTNGSTPRTAVESPSEQAESVAGSETQLSSAPVVELNGVTVSYAEGARPVLKGIDWTLRPGEKWHLQGANGSGKTTLLSLILGHHPRSFSLPPESLKLFDKPRRAIPLTSLRKMIGHTSPEIFAAFPRGMGLSAAQAVGSGFEGVFSRRGLHEEQKMRVLDLLRFVRDHLAPARQTAHPAPSPAPSSPATPAEGSTTATGADTELRAIANRPFAHFTPPQQALLLFLRALVGRPGLVILDEPSQGVDEAMWARCVELLRKEWAERPEMCTVVVSHYEDEVPWGKGEGKVMRLVDGKGSRE
jgi:ABC-type molybdenum transport system ATPase subunit/photorepair protein PhrA